MKKTLRRHGGFVDIDRLRVRVDLFCLFMSRHEVHSMNTHTLQNAG